MLCAVDDRALSHAGLASLGDGFELIKLASHGWSEAQRSGRIAATSRSIYLAPGDRRSTITRTWREQGRLAADAEPDDVAHVVLSMCLGSLAQEALTGSADPHAHERGLAELTASSLAHR